MSSSIFKTPAGEAKYMAAYDATMKLWPGPYESYYVPTRFGRTHITASGPKDAPPLVLIHGLSVSAAMWIPNITELSGSYRLYAPDVMGEVGRSVSEKPMVSRSDCAEWLADVLNEFKIGKTHVAGLSKGGWLALNFAITAPERVKSLVLLAPSSAFTQVKFSFFLKALKLAVFPSRQAVDSTLRWVSPGAFNGNKLGENLAEQMFTGLQQMRFMKTVIPRPFPDEELRAVRIPTMLLLAEREVLFDIKPFLDRAVRLIPDIEAEIITGAGHYLNLDEPELINDRILRFIAGKG